MSSVLKLYCCGFLPKYIIQERFRTFGAKQRNYMVDTYTQLFIGILLVVAFFFSGKSLLNSATSKSRAITNMHSQQLRLIIESPFILELS